MCSRNDIDEDQKQPNIKETIILIVVFLIFTTSVNASLLDGLRAYYSFEGNAQDNTSNNADATVTGATLNSSGKIGNCYNCDGNDFISMPFVFQGNVNWSVSYWVKFDTNSNTYDAKDLVSFQIEDDATTTGVIVGIQDEAGQGSVRLHDGSSWNIQIPPADTPTKTWFHIVITHDGGTHESKIYYNAVLTNTTTKAHRSDLDRMEFCRYYTSIYGKSIIDEAAFYNKTLTQAEITSLNNNNNSLPYPLTVSGPGIQPSLTLYSDLINGSVTNATYYNFYFNGTSVNNSNLYSCSLYADSDSKGSISSQDISSSKNISFSLPNTEDYVNFTLNCFNENASSNISAIYYVDNIPSVLQWAYPNGTYYNDEALYTNFSITDVNLYAFEWLVYQGSTLKENITHVGISADTYDVYNLSAVSQVTGNYNWQLNVWENHNPLISANLFEEYDTIKEESKVTYSYDDKAYSISSFDKMTVTTETKDLKQYFEFELAKDQIVPKEFTYYLEYDGNLVYLPDSQYQGHFVMWDIKRYVDFVCNAPVKVTKITPNKYQILTSCTKFETTGNLNYQQFSGNFTITTPPSLSDEYLAQLVTNTQEINNNLDDIKEVLTMVGLIILWLGLWIFGYYAMQTRNELLAGTMIMLTLPIDIYFAYAFREVLMLGTGYIGVAMGFMTMWSIGVFMLMKRNTGKAQRY